VLIAYPILIRALGAEAFGVYVLATSVSGILAFLDFGTTSATTKFVAQYSGMTNQRDRLADVVSASLIFNVVVGLIIIVAIFAASTPLYSYLVKQPVADVDGPRVFEIAAIQFALLTLVSVGAAVLKGLHRFDLAALILVSYSACYYGLSLLGTLFSDSRLLTVMLFATVGSGLSLVVTWIFVRSAFSGMGAFICKKIPTWNVFQEILRFSAIMSVNTIAGALLYNLQRYMAGRFIGAFAVTAFFVPFALASKGHSFVNAANEVLYPYASSGTHNTVKLREVYVRMTSGTVATSGILAAVLILFAGPILRFWVGADLSETSAPLLKILAVGFFFLAITPPPFHLFNGLGKPQLNTVFALFNAFVNCVLVAAFALTSDKLDLEQLAWAFTIANGANAIGYHLLAERIVWKHICPPSK
jgi:O-antigen/teichoic acid export membrane protein